jgi:hypothetical protein
MAFGAKGSTYFGGKTQRGGRAAQAINMAGTQKFGDKKNTTQIFSNTVYLAKENQRDRKTQGGQHPYDQHPFTPQGPQGMAYPTQEISGLDPSVSANGIPPPGASQYDSFGHDPTMNRTANDFNPLDDKAMMTATAQGGFEAG